MSFSLKLLGGVSLTGGTGPVTGPAVQRHRLALLALLATARPGAVSRDKLMTSLWPERDTEPARRLLNQAVHALRQALGAEAIRSAGEDLQLDVGIVRCDVVELEEALAAGHAERATALYAGPFLDGFFLDEAPEFERWAERERGRLAAGFGKALERHAAAAEAAGDWGAAAERWRARAAHDPYDSRVALRLMQALERAGNRAGALQHALQHAQLLRTELEIEPPPEVRSLVERLRGEPPAASPRNPPPASAPHPPASAAPEPAPPAPEPAGPRIGTPAALRYAAAALVLLAGVGAIRIAARETASARPSPEVVDEIARAVSRELDRRERGDTSRRLPEQRTRSLAAYELFLRGDDPALVRSDSGTRKGLEYFQRAVALDSTFAAAWVGLARMTYRASGPGPAARAEARARAEPALRKALALDDSLAEGHALLGVYRAMDYDWAEAEWHFRRSLSLQPARTRSREWLVQFLLLTGRPAEALVEAERMVARDPLAPAAIAELARSLAANGRCDEALARLEPLATLDPPLLRVPSIAARCLMRAGRESEAVALLRPAAERDVEGVILGLLGYLLARTGQPDEALAIQARLLQRWERGEAGAMYLVYVPAGLGKLDEAFAWLDRAREDGSLVFNPGVWSDLADIPFDALARDPRFARIRALFGHQNR